MVSLKLLLFVTVTLLGGANAFSSIRLHARSSTTRQLATSSRDLKDRGKRTQGKRTAADIGVVLKRLSRARALRNTVKNTVRSPSTVTGDDRVGKLTQLTEAIDARLRGNGPSSNFVDGRINLSRDPIGALLGFNNEEKTKAGHEIVVLFGKHLIDDQVTVEYASRIRTLAQLLKNEELDPDLICFCGEIRQGNHVSDSDAGFMFFKHVCANEESPRQYQILY
ncbi:hypothetical protein MHU86_21116 [Fragilaria crotonensis]|nr:hypothetical protein MHU86_21116 [Fragilaria crotonensis]